MHQRASGAVKRASLTKGRPQRSQSTQEYPPPGRRGTKRKETARSEACVTCGTSGRIEAAVPVSSVNSVSDVVFQLIAWMRLIMSFKPGSVMNLSYTGFIASWYGFL